MKIRSILLAVVLGSSLLAVPAQAATQLTVGVAYDIGGRGDKSFNDASAAGLDKAQKQFDFNLEAVVTDGTSADREKRIRSLITKNCNPIIAIGAGYAPTLQALSVEFPNTHFAIINDASVAALNVTSVIFANTQGAYLAGFSAAQVSKTGKVAMIANPDQADIYKDGFSAGVFASKKKVIPIVKYVSGSYSAATNQVIDAGADVLFVATQGSDSEVFKVIVARNAKKKGSNIGLINVEPDQYITVTSATKKFLIASVVKRVDKAIYDIIALSAAKKQYLDILDSEAGIYGRRYGITGGGIEFTIRSKELLALSASINVAAATAEKIPA
jgi:basic membrane protein A